MSEILNYFRGDELAAKAWASKYALRDKNNNMLEKTPDDMHKRMAKQFARIEEKYKDKGIPESIFNTLSEYGRNIFFSNFLSEDEIYELFKDFKYVIPGGSVMSMLGNPYQIGSLSNCFVIGQPSDSYGGIMYKRTEQAQLMKRRGGVGKDLSLLRPKGSFVNNAAKTSTGPVSFMEVDSEITREVAQDGRRGALMLTININHPDSGDFIVKKQNPTSVTGANISVQLTDRFMQHVEKDEDFIQAFPISTNEATLEYLDEVNELTYNSLKAFEYTDNEKVWAKRIHAKELWNSLIHCAWNTAEPGIMFEDRHHNYSPDGVYPQYKGVTTNPCGEIFMQPYDSCRLIHINLTSFVINPFTDSAQFDINKFYEVAYKTMRLADDMIDLEIEAIDEIIKHIYSNEQIDTDELKLWSKIQQNARDGRRAGIGFTGLADTFAMLGFKYGDINSLGITDLIMSTKLEAELDCTIDMAITRGTFDGFDRELEYPTDPNIPKLFGNDFYEFIWGNYPEQAHRMYDYGRRNISWSTVAPTGTVSIMGQISSGIEPIFAPYYERSKKCMSDSDRVDFIDSTGEKFTKFYVIHEPFKKWILSSEVKDIDNLSKEQLDYFYKISPWFGSDSASIDWKERVELQAVVQKYTTHSISSTLNLPKDTKEELISEIYMTAWKAGLKGITVYRDGCRDGILNNISTTVIETKETIKEHSAPKRPKSLPAELHVVKSQGITYAVIVGLLNEKPFEIFAYELKKGSVGEKMTKNTIGTITKVKKGQYEFKSDSYIYPNLQLANDKIEERACTIYTSMLLRHGAAIPFIIDTTRKINDNISSFSSAMCRVLGKYTEKEVLKGERCPECGGEMIREAGCTKCTDCGSSHCLMIHQIK